MSETVLYLFNGFFVLILRGSILFLFLSIIAYFKCSICFCRITASLRSPVKKAYMRKCTAWKKLYLNMSIVFIEKFMLLDLETVLSHTLRIFFKFCLCLTSWIFLIVAYVYLCFWCSTKYT